MSCDHRAVAVRIETPVPKSGESDCRRAARADRSRYDERRRVMVNIASDYGHADPVAGAAQSVTEPRPTAAVPTFGPKLLSNGVEARPPST
jgi:hypothetical protein